MIRVNHWATTALSAGFLLLTLLIACTRVIHAEPATEEKAASPTSLTALAVAEQERTSPKKAKLHNPRRRAARQRARRRNSRWTWARASSWKWS